MRSGSANISWFNENVYFLIISCCLQLYFVLEKTFPCNLKQLPFLNFAISALQGPDFLSKNDFIKALKYKASLLSALIGFLAISFKLQKLNNILLITL
jgi:hypothetical protein